MSSDLRRLPLEFMRFARRIVLEGEIPDRGGPLRWTLLAVRALVLAAMRFERDSGRERAAALAYSSLLALIPMALLGVSSLEYLYTPSADEPDATQLVLDAFFPKAAEPVKDGFAQYFDESRRVLESTGAGTGIRLLSIGLLVYFATSLMTGVDRMVAAIWGTARYRRLMRRLSAYWAALTLGPLILAMSFAGTVLAADVLGDGAGALLRNLLRFSVTWVAVFLFYRLMPHTRVRTGAALVGAVCAGSMWESTKLAMGWYLGQPKTLLTAMTIFPAALLWMYVSWVIAILGLEIAYIVQHGAWRAGRRAGRARLAGVEQDALVLAVAVEVAHAFDVGRSPDRAAIAASVGVGEDDARRALMILEDADIVGGAENGGFRPSRGSAGVTALEVVRASRGEPPAERASARPAAAHAARDFLRRLESAGSDDLGDVTVADLVEQSRAAP